MNILFCAVFKPVLSVALEDVLVLLLFFLEGGKVVVGVVSVVPYQGHSNIIVFPKGDPSLGKETLWGAIFVLLGKLFHERDLNLQEVVFAAHPDSQQAQVLTECVGDV